MKELYIIIINSAFKNKGDESYMEKIIGAIILGVIAAACFVFSFLQFKEKGFLFNNAYIYASEKERETMNKKPHYKQSGIVFLLIGIIFLINAVNMMLQTKWLFYLIIAVAVIAVFYAVISSIITDQRKNKT